MTIKLIFSKKEKKKKGVNFESGFIIIAHLLKFSFFFFVGID